MIQERAWASNQVQGWLIYQPVADEEPSQRPFWDQKIWNSLSVQTQVLETNHEFRGVRCNCWLTRHCLFDSGWYSFRWLVYTGENIFCLLLSVRKYGLVSCFTACMWCVDLGIRTTEDVFQHSGSTWFPWTCCASWWQSSHYHFHEGGHPSLYHQSFEMFSVVCILIPPNCFWCHSASI